MKNQKGVFLISSILILSVIGTYSLALFAKSATVHRTAERAQNRVIAFHLAESGVDQAIVQLRTNPNFDPDGAYTAFGEGGYQVDVATPDPVASPTIRLITATGHTPNNVPTAFAYERRQVQTYVNLTPQGPFTYGLFSDLETDMSGNAVVDSYDSRNGPYNPSQPGTNGDVGTNATGASSVKLSGNSRVRGDAVAGPGATVSGNCGTSAICTSGNAEIEGTRSALSSAKTLDSVQIPTSLTNLGDLSVSGNNTVTLGGGTYWYNTIKISGNGKVDFTGAATVYVTGKIEVSGNGIGTASNAPPNLLIYSQGQSSGIPGGGDVKVSGNGNFYGAIYAPDSTINISGNGMLYGALVGDKVKDSGNGNIHFDEALSQVGASNSSGVALRAWQEV